MAGFLSYSVGLPHEHNKEKRISRDISEYSHLEERLNVLSHAFGAALALFAWLLLVVKALQSPQMVTLISVSIFGGSLFLLYMASTLYHSAKTPVKRRRLKIFDHCAIYLLIAGTYTPFTLVTLKGSLGWWLFAISWAMAAIGIVLKFFFTGRFNLVSTSMYVAMGWLIIFAIKPLMAAFPALGLAWLVAGGISYTLGAVLYSIKAIPFNHAIFHGFVLLGSICHFVSVFYYIL